MVAANVKADIKKQEIKDLVAYLTNVYKNYLEIQYKKGLYFSFNFGWYSIHLDIVRYGQGDGVGRELLNGQNPLRVTKVFVDSPLARSKVYIKKMF